MGTPVYAEMKMDKRVLVVTNDSTVFLVKNRIASAFEMFGGRATEVKNLVERLDTAKDEKGRKVCDVSYGVITTRYGFVPGNYQIMSYENVMSDKAGYLAADEERHFVEQVSFLMKPFDKVVMCVPNDMFQMFLDRGEMPDGALIAVTAPRFREECEAHGWTWLERRGARVGSANADEIERIVRALRSLPRLEVQEAPLRHGAAAVVADPARGRDDPVARHYYRQRVGPARRPDRPVGLRVAGGLGDLGVRAHLAVRYLREGAHDVHEEVGALVVDLHVEFPPLAGEVLVDLVRGLEEGVRLGLVHGWEVLAGQVQRGYAALAVLRQAHAAEEGYEGVDAGPAHAPWHAQGQYIVFWSEPFSRRRGIRAAMIISASRRTDIPAFHSGWMMNRLRAGYCLVRNPVSRTTVHRVDLTRRSVDCIQFVTKDPRPMVPHLREVASMGHVCMFQVTLTPYGRDLEPGVPPKADVSDACAEISDIIGRDRIAWRYDPVLFSGRISPAYHARKFDLLCREASRWTDRCIFSFVDIYGRLVAASSSGLFRQPTAAEAEEFCAMASRTAAEYGISLSACCERMDLSRFGIEPRGCFDAAQMRALDIPYEPQASPLREGCRCVRSVDIGEYGTCAHGCAYCYAGGSGLPAGSSRLYSEDSELLWGAVSPRDRVVGTAGREASRLEDFWPNR